MTDHPYELSARSTPALISYALLAIFGLTVIGIFAIIFFRVPVDALMAGVLGSVLGSTGTGYAAVQGFWIGSSSSAKAAQSDLANSTRNAQASLAQLAGAGPPPPAAPVGAEEK